MATIELLGNAAAMGDRLRSDLRDAHRCSIAVAFAKESALESVDLLGWVRPERPLKLLAGTDFECTELELLRRLSVPGAECRIFHKLPGATFHPKLYLLERPGRRVAYVGSSNLTHGGLHMNVEANVRIEGDVAEPELDEPAKLFDKLFQSELSTPVSDEFEARYKEMQEQRRSALVRYAQHAPSAALQVAENLLIGQYRAQQANHRHIIVVTPRNYDMCMQSLTCGRRNEKQIHQFEPGDVFFFHLTGGRGVRAMGMFTGPAYYDDDERWKHMDDGAYPWRRGFLVLGELRTEIPTRAILDPLRPGAPKNWFNGFIQASHTLKPEEFEALRVTFEKALRVEKGMLGLGNEKVVPYPTQG